jgi:DNA-binding beta-propeller fold protein YncE
MQKRRLPSVFFFFLILNSCNSNALTLSDDHQNITLSIFAGERNQNGSNDGIGTSSQFSTPSGISISSDNNFAIISDQMNNLIRLITLSTASVSTLAGSGSIGNTNGVGTNSKFHFPFGISVSSDREYCLVADRDNHLIRQIILSTAMVTTLAGDGGGGREEEGEERTNTKFYYPFDVSISPSRTFALVADSYSNCIRSITLSTRLVTVFAGSSSGAIGSIDGIGTQARFNLPIALTFSPTGCYCLVSDYHNQLIRRIVITSAMVTTLISSGVIGNENGIGTNAKFHHLLGLSLSSEGSYLYVIDYTDRAIRQIIVSTTTVTTLRLVDSSKNESVLVEMNDEVMETTTSTRVAQSSLQWPSGVAISPNGEFVLIADAGSHTIRKFVNPNHHYHHRHHHLSRHETTLEPVPGSEETKTRKEILCPKYTARDTNNATKNVISCGLLLCPQETATLVFCGSSSAMVRLVNSRGVLVASTSGANCDDCSSLSFSHNRLTVDQLWDCDLLSLKQGCSESESCTGISKVLVTLSDVLVRYSFGVLFGDQSVMSSKEAILLNYFGNQGGGGM